MTVSKIFYATYTAYSGRAIRSELIETTDFRSFRMSPLGGSAARNKGMALFPRKIDGRYAMIGRQDNENLYLIYSDDLYTWDGGRSILQPEYPWEFVQIGNCGSPVELDDCWLLLTHGVGPVRHYSIGAVLLDKKDPSKVLARSREPLVRPEPTEREGYVPSSSGSGCIWAGEGCHSNRRLAAAEQVTLEFRKWGLAKGASSWPSRRIRGRDRQGHRHWDARGHVQASPPPLVPG